MELKHLHSGTSKCSTSQNGKRMPLTLQATNKASNSHQEIRQQIFYVAYALLNVETNFSFRLSHENAFVWKLLEIAGKYTDFHCFGIVNPAQVCWCTGANWKSKLLQVPIAIYPQVRQECWRLAWKGPSGSAATLVSSTMTDRTIIWYNRVFGGCYHKVKFVVCSAQLGTSTMKLAVAWCPASLGFVLAK